MLKRSFYIIDIHKTTLLCRYKPQIHNVALHYKKFQPNNKGV